MVITVLLFPTELLMSVLDGHTVRVKLSNVNWICVFVLIKMLLLA